MEIKIRCDYRDENEALDLDQGNYPSKTPKKRFRVWKTKN
jgi:hypothetical protein